MRTGQLEVRYLASPLRPPRVGIIVPKYGKSAVARNKVKRRLRELVRLELLPMLAERPALEVVIRATPSAYAASYETLRAALQKATAQLPGEARQAGQDVPVPLPSKEGEGAP